MFFQAARAVAMGTLFEGRRNGAKEARLFREKHKKERKNGSAVRVDSGRGQRGVSKTPYVRLGQRCTNAQCREAQFGARNVTVRRDGLTAYINRVCKCTRGKYIEISAKQDSFLCFRSARRECCDSGTVTRKRIVLRYAVHRLRLGRCPTDAVRRRRPREMHKAPR